MKTFVKQLFFLLLLILPQAITAAKHPMDDDAMVVFESLSVMMRYQYGEAVNILNSLEESFDGDQFDVYNHHLEYFYGYIRYREGNYKKALELLDGALEAFMYNEEDEWTAKSLILLGCIAEESYLLPEAINSFGLAREYAVSDRSKYLSGLGMVRVRMSMKKPFKDDFDLLLTEFYTKIEPELVLYTDLLRFWYFRNSGDAEVQLPIIAGKYADLGMHIGVSDTYKVLALHYKEHNDNDNSLLYLTKSIEAYERELDHRNIPLANLLHTRASLYLAMDSMDLCYSDVFHAIDLNQKAGCMGNNYILYQFLSDIESQNKNYRRANKYLKQSIRSLRYQNAYRLERYSVMSNVFLKISYISKQLEVVKRNSLIRMIAIAVFFLLIVFLLIRFNWVRQSKLKVANAEIQDDNTKLKAVIAKTVIGSRKQSKKDNVIKASEEIFHKVDRFLDMDTQESIRLQESFAASLLCFKKKFPTLSDLECTQVTLIALKIPPKEMASILCVQPTTVAQYRTRLRKKLGISNTGVKFEDYLDEILKEEHIES